MKQQETELIVGNTKCKLIMDYHLYEHTPTSRSHTHTNYELIYV